MAYIDKPFVLEKGTHETSDTFVGVLMKLIFL